MPDALYPLTQWQARHHKAASDGSATIDCRYDQCGQVMVKYDDNHSVWVVINALEKRIERLEQILIAANDPNNPRLQELRREWGRADER